MLSSPWGPAEGAAGGRVGIAIVSATGGGAVGGGCPRGRCGSRRLLSLRHVPGGRTRWGTPIRARRARCVGVPGRRDGGWRRSAWSRCAPVGAAERRRSRGRRGGRSCVPSLGARRAPRGSAGRGGGGRRRRRGGGGGRWAPRRGRSRRGAPRLG